MSQRSLPEWLEWLEQLHPKAIDLGLERVTEVARRMGVLNFSIPVITVGGTNGKGSCVATLQAIFQAAGYRVGAYFSPHLLQYNERIHILGRLATNQEICTAFERINQVRGNISLTYFEFGTLAALDIFHQASLDIIILEVGLGGRLDAVNIISADLAVITSIDLDHMEWLGNDRESIAYEKAGIFRAYCPAVCGDTNPPDSLLQAAREKNVRLYCLERDFYYHSNVDQWVFTIANRVFAKSAEPTTDGREQQDKLIAPVYNRGAHNRGSSEETTDAIPSMLEIGFLKNASIVLENLPETAVELTNAAAALMAVTLLQERLPVSLDAIKDGLRKIKLLGRQQQIAGEIPVILDVAHNPAAAKLLASYLQRHPIQGRTFAVFGMLADKAIAKTAIPLVNEISAWYVGSLSGPRGADSKWIKTILEQIGIKKISTYVDITSAYQAAYAELLPGDRLLVWGSFHTVADVLTTECSRNSLM